MNNKGFTLIELLAVLVILTVIMGIALPSISSSMERSKEKQNESRLKVIIASAELYLTDNKNTIYRNLKSKNINSCRIELKSDLVDNGYLLLDEMKKSDNKNEFSGWIIFNKNDFTFTYNESGSTGEKCK